MRTKNPSVFTRRALQAGLAVLLVSCTPHLALAEGALKGTDYFPVYIVGVLLVGLGAYLSLNSAHRLDQEKEAPQIRIAKGVRGEDFHKKDGH